MTDNFYKFRKLIQLNGGIPNDNICGTLDKYYVVELLRRGKDSPNMPAANYHFKNYYIYSWRDLEKYEKEIKEICKLLRLRAYCSVNYKLMSQVALDTLAESARRIALHDYKKFYSIFESCSGKFADRGNNLWIVDVDDVSDETSLEKLSSYINSMKSSHEVNTLIVFPTKSGFHFICHPFNLQTFNKNFISALGDWFKEIPEVKKNHLTLLYENL